MTPHKIIRSLIHTLSIVTALVVMIAVCEAAPERCDTSKSQGTFASADPKNKKYLNATLVREVCANGCITGTLTIPRKDGKNWTCKTLELPNNGNKQNNSCIPGQRTYVCERVDSPTFGDTFEITDVPGNRDNILFHVGNFPRNTSGCVLLGMAVDPKTNFLMSSKPAVAAFLRELEGYNKFLLTVEDKTKTCPKPPPGAVAAR